MNEKKVILVLHEDQIEAKKICKLLTKFGYKALTDDTVKDIHLVICWDFSDISALRKRFLTPVIFVSANTDEKNIVEALDAGASDYFVPPFGSQEHFARIRAVLRDFTAESSDNDFTVGGLHINFPSRTVLVDGEKTKLTPIEFRILTLLVKNHLKVVTHEQIINDIWGPFNSDNLVVRVNVANIRRKIEKDPSLPRYILTETGIGYKIAGE